MNPLSRLLFAVTTAGALASLGALSGCTASVSADPLPGEGAVPVPTQPTVTNGRLVLRWTVNSTTDPSSCQLSAASAIRIDVYDLSGRSFGQFVQACDAFATTVDLPPGDYTADALLQDVAGGARTTTLSVNPFRIVAGTDLVIDVDFPADSFFQ